MLTVQVAAGANGVVNEQVVPVIENRPAFPVIDSAVIESGPEPVFWMVT
jgi:hypothetical protein